MCLAGVWRRGRRFRIWRGWGWRQSESRRERPHVWLRRGDHKAEHEKLMLTDGQAKAALEFVLLVVEEGPQG